MNTKKNKKNTSMKTLPPKKKTIDKNKLLAYILAVLIIFWTVAGVFGLIAFGRTTKKSSNVISASAQTVENFETYEQLVIDNCASNFYLTNASSSFMEYHGFDYKFVFGNYKIGLTRNGVFTDFTSTSSQFIEDNIIDTLVGGSELEDVYVSCAYNNIIDFATSWNEITYNFTCEIGQGSQESGNYDSIYLYHSFTFRLEGQSNLTSTVIWTFEYPKFYPYQDSYIIFPRIEGNNEFNPSADDYFTKPQVPSGFATEDFLFYYFTALGDPEFSMAYERGYDKGYADGKSIVNRLEYARGFNDGKKQGLAIGKDEGYQLGLNESNPYTFANLLSAVIDVPVQTFASLFNFELLGVNLLEFFLALFSAGLILAIIRLIL